MKEIKFSFLLLITIITYSCSDKMNILEEQNNRDLTSIDVNLSVNIHNEINTRAGTNDNEDQNIPIQDLWVFQFDNHTNRIVGIPKYYSQQGLKAISLYQGNNQKLVFVANTHDEHKHWGITTLASLLDNKVYASSQNDCFNGNENDLLYHGMIDDINISENTRHLSAHLKRNIVKYTFQLKNRVDNLNITNVKLCQVNNAIHYIEDSSTDTTTPEGEITLNYTSQQLDENGIHTFYFPANRQGTTNNRDYRNKNTDAPNRATYVEVFMEKEGNQYILKIYPGENNTNDFNLLANHSYSTKIVINSLSEIDVDSRCTLSTQVFSEEESEANSFIINSDARSVFGFYPHAQINKFWRLARYAVISEGQNNLIFGDNDEWTAEVLWQDVPYNDYFRFINDDEGLAETYTGHGQKPLMFVVNKNYKNQSANIILAIKIHGEIVWSFHLWITNYNPNITPTPINQNRFEVKNGEVHKYNDGERHSYWINHQNRFFMDRNLGARSTTSPNEHNEGALFYQFGRKDPFPAQSFNNPSVSTQLYTIHGELIVAPYVIDNHQPISIVQSINYPNRFVKGNGSNWCAENDDSSYDWNDPTATNNQKSIYDPCPKGWKVPESDAFNDFRNQQSHESSRGYNYLENIFFPYTGYRGRDEREPIFRERINESDEDRADRYADFLDRLRDWQERERERGDRSSTSYDITDKGTYGGLWTSQTRSKEFGFFLSYSDTGLILQGEGIKKNTAYCVRCIKE